jgi:hypothetical protein
MARMEKAGAAIALPLNQQTFKMMVKDYQGAKPEEKTKLSLKSYWHMMTMIYDPENKAQYPMEYPKKPKDINDWTRNFKKTWDQNFDKR